MRFRKHQVTLEPPQVVMVFCVVSVIVCLVLVVIKFWSVLVRLEKYFLQYRIKVETMR